MALLSLREISLAFGGPRLFDQADFHIEQGERVCLLGRNGEGKSTLLRLILGEIQPDEGEVVRRQGLRVSRLEQDVPRTEVGSVAEVVARGLDERDRVGTSAGRRVDAILSRMSLDPEARFESLSSGMKRRVLLARALVAEPDVLLLDEPTNHLDVAAIEWLEEFLSRFAGTLVFVTHDRAFLTRLATRIVELDRGRLQSWDCDYPTFLKRRDELLEAEERQRALFDKKLAQEETWIRKGVEARRTRNEGRVRALKVMRDERRKRRERQSTARIQVQEAERGGTMVVEAKGVGFSYGGREVIRGLETTIYRGDKVGLIGPNGAGKTTLLRLLLGELTPTSGAIRLGTNLEVAYFDQLKAGLDEEKSVQKNVSEYDTITINGQPRHIIGYLQDFLFTPDRARTLVKFLSGGERSRLLLAKLFTRPSNVLVLDEPTNDLDIETLELLESLIVEYQGTVLLVSHDRAFLNNVVASTLVIDSEGNVREFEGGHDDAVRQMAAAAVTAGPKSTAIAAPPRAEAAAAADDRPRKLSFKERRELETLPATIETLEAAVRELHASMADPAFFRQEKGVIAEANARLATLENQLAEAYDRWESLEASGV